MSAKGVGTFVNIIAICKEATDVINLVSRAGKDLTKREVTLVDQSGASIIWTLWGEEAQKFKSSEQPVVLLKGAKIGEFAGGKTLGASTMKLNPDIPESHNLLEWFKTGGHQKDVKSLSCTNGNFFTEWAFVNDINPSGQFKSKSPGFYRIKASIKKIIPDYYEACINTGCYKKVSERNGTYKCIKCNNESTEFIYSVLINMCIDDWTSECGAIGFSEVSEKLFKKNSNEIIEMIRNNSINTVIKDLKFQQRVFKYHEYNEMLISNIERLTDLKINKAESMDITTDSQNEPMEILKENESMDITRVGRSNNFLDRRSS
ncbi:CLUMA_CG001173, isoform A [Clunio marinus]|uniref:CLUMA_CG001173, isoform A n=1 Tax=Clunio marinus TaxID=568069 RepID=A0A1J1HHL0_9DIPT|nr:CLUMA_CG001173, isoform A [Clunio marinus]